jgi:integrase
VAQGRLPASPLRAPSRRVTGQRVPFIFDMLSARRLLDLAASLPDNARAPLRGQTYRTIFLVLYGLGLRVGEVSRLSVADVDLERRLTLRFLQSLEVERHNHVRTRNHRRAVLVGFFDYLARQLPDRLAVSQQVAAIPVKRASPPETRFIERVDVLALFKQLPTRGQYASRNRILLLFLYNTGARVQEVADLRVGHLDLSGLRVRLHGKGDKWRIARCGPILAKRSGNSWLPEAF